MSKEHITMSPPLTTTDAPGQVAFSYQEWVSSYPHFANNVTESQALGFFQLAGLILNNSARSPVRDMEQRKMLLWLLVAHQAQLFATSDAQTNHTAPVGRIASATRGSVSLTLDGSALPRNAGWFTQTQYGLTFWQATAAYRQMRFLPGRTHPAYIWP